MSEPSDPEEGDIYADAEVVVFRSTAVLDVTPVLKGRTLTITGAVHEVDFDRYDEDPAAEPVGHRPARRSARGPTGRHQDQREDAGHPPDGHPVRLHRQAHVPVYESIDPDEGRCLRRFATTGADGTFRLSITVKGGDHSYG